MEKYEVDKYELEELEYLIRQKQPQDKSLDISGDSKRPSTPRKDAKDGEVFLKVRKDALMNQGIKYDKLKEQTQKLQRQLKYFKEDSQRLKQLQFETLAKYIEMQKLLEEKMAEDVPAQNRMEHDMMLSGLSVLVDKQQITRRQFNNILNAHSNFKNAMKAVKQQKLKFYISNSPYDNTDWRCALIGTNLGKYQVVHDINSKNYSFGNEPYWEVMKRKDWHQFHNFKKK